MSLFDKSGVIYNLTPGIRILHQSTKDLVMELKRAVISSFNPESQGVSAGLYHLNGLRMALCGDKEDAPRRLERVAQGHGFRSGGGLIEQRSIGHFQPGEVGYHRLEVEQSLKASLCDFGLVRGVRRVPAGVLQQVALNNGGHVAIVVAHANIRTEDLVLRGDFL